MKRGEAYFAMVGNKFFLFRALLIDSFHRHPLKPGAITSVFLWKKVDDHKESFSRAKRLQARCEAASRSAKAEVSTHQNKEREDNIRDCSNEQNDSVVFDPPRLEEQIEAMKNENERLLHELQESKRKERIYKLGLERFSSSSKDIKFYTGFPDYPTLIEFWKYVVSSASNILQLCA